MEVSRPVEGERKLVTVLFADVVGSTAMGEQLDPEQVLDIMNGAFAFLNAGVARYGGTVARLMGDANLALFGAPVAHEDDAERAVYAGLAIQSAASEYARHVRRHYGVDLYVRVGINTGLAALALVGDEIKAEYTAIGDTTNVAARLQSIAEPGTVLISAATYRLVKHLFEVKPIGAVIVKGRSAPVEAYQVLAPKETPGTPRGLEGISSPLVGRDAELRLLTTQLDNLQTGEGAFVAVVGEAGLGKSRLGAEARKHTDPHAITWLEGRGISYGQSIGYYLWQQVLRRSVGAHEHDLPADVRARLETALALRDLPDGDLPFLETLLGVESATTLQTVGTLEGDARVETIAEATRRYLGALARVKPAVIVFDDLHWADDASLELLLDISELVSGTPLLLVALLRPDRDAASWSFVKHARRKLGPWWREITLEPLSDESAGQLLTNLLDVEGLPGTVRELLLTKAEGNPFFLEEVIRALIDSHHIVYEDNRWRAAQKISQIAIPDSLSALLSARIDRLPEDTKRVVQMAAVLGRTFAYRVLKVVCETVPLPERIEPLEPHLDRLTYEQLLREHNREPEIEYIFKHALIQEAAYNSLLIRRRKEFHRRAGEVLEALYPQRLDELAPTLALHFRTAEQWERAADYSTRAGAQAMKVYALRQAYDHYERACEAIESLPAPPPERIVDATLDWAAVAYKLRRYSQVLDRLARAEEHARRLGDKRRLALALHWIGSIHLATGSFSRAIPALAENAQLAAEIGDERLSVVPRYFTGIEMVDSDPRAAVAQFEHVISLAEALQDREIQSMAHGAKAVAHARIGEFVQAEQELQRALTVASRTRSLLKEAEAEFTSGLAYLDMGNLVRGLEFGERGTEKARAANVTECTMAGLYCVGMGKLRARDWSAAMASFEEATRLAESSGLEGLNNQVRAGLAVARFYSGRTETLEEMEETRTNALALGDLYTAAFLSHELGQAYMQLGRLDRAEETLKSALDFYRRNDMRPYLPRTLQALADLYDRLDRTTDAASLRSEAEHLLAELEVPLP